MSPVINGRTDEVEEEKGATFMDSPSMRPGNKEEVDIRKMAIMKNAQAHAVLGEAAGMKSPQFIPKTPEERGREIKSTPATPPMQAKGEEPKGKIQPGEPKSPNKSAFATRNADGSPTANDLNKLKSMDS
jgi:hypothetical protein